MHKPIRTLVSAAVLGVLTTSAAHAGGFSLYTESSAAAIGNYAAGIAAEAADASTGWYNPAGLALIPTQQAVFSGVGIFPTAKLTGSSTFATPGIGLPNYTQSFDGLNGGDNAFVPAFHYALPLGENAGFGISVVAPFGLATDWGNSAVRYQGTLTELITTNISPEFGARVTEHFAVGAGLDIQYARVKFNTILGAPNFYAPAFPTLVDTLSYNNGNSVGVGFHAGVMSMFNDNHTRLGLNYQSEMRHKFHGQSRLTGPFASPGLVLIDPLTVTTANPNAVFKNNELFSNPVELPDVLTLSAYHDLNNTISLLGSVVWTGWSSFKIVQLHNVAAPAINPQNTAVSLVQINNTTEENYSDAWRVAVGANYHVNQQLMFRVGGGYDATPTNDAFRDVRLPDVSRWALAVGAHYQMYPTIGMDVGYSHLFGAGNSIVNRTEAIGSSTFNVNATSTASVDLVGAQLVWTMDKPVEVSSK